MLPHEYWEEATYRVLPNSAYTHWFTPLPPLIALDALLCATITTQVWKEFNHPLHRNSFALLFLILVVMARLSANWTDPPSTGLLSRVLYWMGTIPLAALTWFCIARQEENID